MLLYTTRLYQNDNKQRFDLLLLFRNVKERVLYYSA